MEAGSLRHRVTIQAATLSTNAIGERVPTYADVATVYAAIRPASAKEVAYHQAIGQEVTHAISMRYAPAVTSACRLKFGDRIFDIGGIVNPDECNIELRILAIEQSNT